MSKMNIAFYSTNEVFAGEEKLKENDIECEIVPTPATDKAYCGVCIETEEEEAISVLGGMEFHIIRKEAEHVI